MVTSDTQRVTEFDTYKHFQHYVETTSVPVTRPVRNPGTPWVRPHTTGVKTFPSQKVTTTTVWDSPDQESGDPSYKSVVTNTTNTTRTHPTKNMGTHRVHPRPSPPLSKTHSTRNFGTGRTYHRDDDLLHFNDHHHHNAGFITSRTQGLTTNTGTTTSPVPVTTVFTETRPPRVQEPSCTKPRDISPLLKGLRVLVDKVSRIPRYTLSHDPYTDVVTQVHHNITTQEDPSNPSTEVYKRKK